MLHLNYEYLCPGTMAVDVYEELFPPDVVL